MPFINNFITYLKQWSLKKKIIWAISIFILIWFWFSIPSKLFNAPTSFIITDNEGNLLNASIATDGQWRFPYNKKVPDKFISCIKVFEDKRFYYHPGIDPIAMFRALKQDLTNKRKVSGGSTITMQVVRLFEKNKKRNIFNKIRECWMATRLECSYSKRSIMALYASNAPFGSNVVGLDAAAWRYYGRNASQLTWGEMAALAVLPNSPSLVHPGKNTTILLRKRNELLDKLINNKIIDQTTGLLAKAELLPGDPKALPEYAPHLLERFKRDYKNLKKEDEEISTSVQTTIVANLQLQVNNLISQQHQQLSGNQIKNAAAIVIEVETGNVLAYVGNVFEPKDSNIESYVDVLASARSPGSTLKPLLYASLLTEGRMLPQQIIPDIPTQIGGYMPVNFDLSYDGAVPADRAISRSLNIPAVKMLQQYKYQRFYDVLKQCGISSLHNPSEFYGMSLILGGCEIIPYELAGIYSSMARMYNHQKKNKNEWNSKDWFFPKYLVRNQLTSKKNKNSISNSSATKLFDYPSLWHTFTAMNEVMRPGEEGLWGMFTSAQKIAWKTGTSFGFRDAWAVGITPKYCVLVWIGNTTGEGRPDLIGINTAAPMLFDIFRLLPTSNWFEKPISGFMYMPVCRKSGYKAGTDCLNSDIQMVSENAKNATPCPYCKNINLDKTGTYRANERCESPSDMIRQSYFILPPTMEFYYKQKHPEYKLLPAFKENCIVNVSGALDVIYPEEGARIFIPKEITGEKGRTIFTATHRNSEAKLFWHLDNDFVGTTQHFHQMALQPITGKHTLTIVDEDGNSMSRNFIIEKKE